MERADRSQQRFDRLLMVITDWLSASTLSDLRMI